MSLTKEEANLSRDKLAHKERKSLQALFNLRGDSKLGTYIPRLFNKLNRTQRYR